MKVPLSWLRDVVAVELTDAAATSTFAEFLSRHGIEVEEVHTPGAGTVGVVTAKVLSWEPHPDADKLRVVRITHGDDEVELVCGASNFDVGDVVVHAPPGGSIPGMTMEARPLRGVVSHGMLASARELQVGEDHDGIMVLDPDVPLGQDIVELLPLGEPVIEVARKGIRADHLSVLGIGRDVAALQGLPFREPEVPVGQPGDAVGVTITDGASHFVVHTVEDVEVPASSPWWVRQRLAQCGVRSISPVVDVTNLVMLELGQPLHAYDLDLVAGSRLGVRYARDGETVVTLDDVERVLTTDDLVIVDGEDAAIGLAGVMGGASTEVSATTTRVAFEAAVWDADTIRDTSRRLRLVSEASIRFERGVDPAGARRAAARAVQLLRELGTATDLGVTEDGAPLDARATVAVDTRRLAAFIGLDELTSARQQELLRAVGCDVAVDGDVLRVTPPTWRNDLLRFADVAEEVARLHGFDRIPATLPDTGVAGGRTRRQRARGHVRDTARAAGLHEVVTRPFVGDEAVQLWLPTDRRVHLANPLAQDAASMRPGLAHGLLHVVRRNVGQGRPGVGVFEMGTIFRPAGDGLDDLLDRHLEDWRWRDPDDKVLPTQPMVLGVALQGRRHGPGWVADDEVWSLHDALAVMDDVARAASGRAIDGLERRPADATGDDWHPGRWASLHLDDGPPVGAVAQLHPRLADALDLPEPVIVGELLLEPLLARDDGQPLVGTPLVQHPAITVDVAVVADDDVSWAEVASVVRGAAGPELDDLRLFDVYRDDALGDGRRSLGARLRLQDPERQLTNDDEARVLDAIRAAVDDLPGAELRS